MNNLIFKAIQESLDKEANLGALALALSLPDLCGKIEYPNEKRSGVRYKAWYNKYVLPTEVEMNNRYRITGAVLYEMRNELYHDTLPFGHKSKKVLAKQFDLSFIDEFYPESDESFRECSISLELSETSSSYTYSSSNQSPEKLEIQMSIHPRDLAIRLLGYTQTYLVDKGYCTESDFNY